MNSSRYPLMCKRTHFQLKELIPPFTRNGQTQAWRITSPITCNWQNIPKWMHTRKISAIWTKSGKNRLHLKHIETLLTTSWSSLTKNRMRLHEPYKNCLKCMHMRKNSITQTPSGKNKLARKGKIKSDRSWMEQREFFKVYIDDLWRKKY